MRAYSCLRQLGAFDLDAFFARRLALCLFEDVSLSVAVGFGAGLMLEGAEEACAEFFYSLILRVCFCAAPKRVRVVAVTPCCRESSSIVWRNFSIEVQAF